jgi:serine/threonine-protein kinase
MDAFAAELEACLAELAAGADGETTLVRGTPVVAAPRPRTRPRRRWPLLLVAAGLMLLAAAVAAILLGRGSGPSNGGNAPSAPLRAVKLDATSTYDPFGDRQEHNEEVRNATDGDSGTFWSTEHYEGFTKPGVGLVLEKAQGGRVRRLAVRSDTPGFTAEVRAGSSSTGPFRTVSPSRTVGAATTYPVSGGSDRFLELWITKLPGGVAHVNEVTARG